MDLGTEPPFQFPRVAWQRDDRHSFLLAGMMWVLLVLMIVPEGFDYSVLATTAAPSSGSFVSRTLWLVLLALGAATIYWRGGLVWLLVRRLNPFLIVMLVLAFASVVWSINPTLSVRRLVRMGTIALCCIAFVLAGWHASRFQAVVRPILTMVLIGSIVFGLLMPTLAIHQEKSAELIGAWRGLATHKNGLGALACIALILWFHAALTSEVKIISALMGGAIATTCLLLSRSSTALVTTAGVLVVLVLLIRSPQGLRPYVPYAVVLLAGTLLMYSLAVLQLIPGLGTLLAPVSVLTDKDLSFTGRTNIWAIIVEHVGNHPLFGTGYGAYWTPRPLVGTDSYVFVTRMGTFYPGSAHNGYLEIINDLGWMGFLCLIGYLAVHIRQSLRMLNIDRNQGILYLALFFQQAITNFSETHWFSVQSVDFVIMTLATTALARGLLEHQLRIVFGNPHPSGHLQPFGNALPSAQGFSGQRIATERGAMT